MAHRRVRTRYLAGVESAIQLYRELLGEAFDRLHPHVQRAHLAPLEAEGWANVCGGRGIAPVVARMLGLPKPGPQQPVHVTVSQVGLAQVWRRRFGNRQTITRQLQVDGRMVEYKGWGRIHFVVREEDGRAVYESVQSWLGVIPVVPPLGISAHGVVAPTPDGWSVEVTIRSPLLGLLCSYQAAMRWM